MPTTGYLRQKNGRYYASMIVQVRESKNLTQQGLQSRTISARLNKY